MLSLFKVVEIRGVVLAGRLRAPSHVLEELLCIIPVPFARFLVGVDAVLRHGGVPTTTGSSTEKVKKRVIGNRMLNIRAKWAYAT